MDGVGACEIPLYYSGWMRLHGPEYQLPNHATRIIVIGVTGSGKTTLCRNIADARGIEHTELDALFHGENWEPRPAFIDDVRELAARDSWITEYQYRDARPFLLERAQVAIWLDLPSRTALSQLFLRTWRRWRSNQELWNGNREPGPRTWVKRSDENILWWGWATRNKFRATDKILEEACIDLVRLRSRRDVHEWCARNLEHAG